MTRSIQETAFGFAPVRAAAGTALLLRGLLRLRSNQRFRAASDFAWVCRVSGIGPLAAVARRRIFDTLASIRRAGRNDLVDAYRADPESVACAGRYAVSGQGGSKDVFRDLIVLKKATSQEKGVILLKYGQTFDAVVALFDLDRLMERYWFVLEPCWAGYCDPSILMFVTPGQPVVVQCFTDADFRFIEDVGAPFVPVRLGPADWVDADLFTPPAIEHKRYDLVMVANWGMHKRHSELFRALRQVHDRDIRVLLIGFPWAGRTAQDIRREAAEIGNDRVRVEIVESLPASDVAARVSECKVFVFLSRKEGDNKALVEAMFVNVPAIVYDRTIGGAGSRINAATGIFSSDENLAGNIVRMIDGYKSFSPRAWALEHTGSAIATKILDDALRRAVTAAGGRYTQPIDQKTNAPNLGYKDPAARARFAADYEFILSCRRAAPVRATEAVA